MASIAYGQHHTGHDVYMTGSSGTLRPPAALHTRRDTISRYLAWSVALILLVSNGPLFLCMPIIDDAALWGLHAQVFLDGGMPYRDVMETNPPGTLWLMAAIRWLLGPSSVALRAADLAILGTVVFLLLQILRDAGVGKSIRAWSGAVSLLFYFSVSEWCHCQRDMWLMVPSLAWLWLRGRQVQRISAADCAASQVIGWSLIEGLVLGAGIWIKPMVLVPAAATWLVGASRVGNWRRSLGDAFGMLLGGLIAGAAGAIWLYGSGVWPHFWETFLEWNPRYVAAGREHWTMGRFAGMCLRLFPWLLLHLPAMGLAIVAVLPGVRVPGRRGQPRHGACVERMQAAVTPAPNDVAGRRENALIAAFYLGWLGQAFALQHLYDYVHAPGILLAILVCASVAGRWPQLHPAARVGLAVFASLALLCSPALSSSRLGCWVQCLPLKSSPEIRDKLKLMQFPDWQELNRVAAFLRACQVRDGDVCCFPNSTIHLYEMLGIRPPTRHVYIENTLVFFPARRELLRTALEAAAPRYAVTDLATAGVPPDVLHRVGPGSIMSGQRADASPAGRVFPWGFPIVFRAGRYAVHQVRKPILSLEVTP